MSILAALPLLAARDDDWGHAWWPLWLLFWAVLIGVAMWVFTRRRDRRADPLDHARGILAERYARSELTAEEYRNRLAQLG